MDRRRALIILNPFAGRSSRGGRLVGRVIEELGALGCKAELRLAGAMYGEIERLAREAEPEFDIIVGAGGDGTMNAIVNGVAGTTRSVGLLPLGTANVLAHEIALPRSAAALARVIASGEARPIWPGRVGDRLFVLMASSGFDAEVVRRVDPRLKRVLGRGAFVASILASITRHRGTSLNVTADGITHCASTVIATKARCYAGPFVLAADASLSDPALHLVLFRRDGRLAASRYMLSLASGRLPHRSDVTILRTREARITGAWPVSVQADGEVIGMTPISIGIADHPVQLVMP